MNAPILDGRALHALLQGRLLTWEGVETLATTGACLAPQAALDRINQPVARQWATHPCLPCAIQLAAELVVAWVQTLPAGGVA